MHLVTNQARAGGGCLAGVNAHPRDEVDVTWPLVCPHFALYLNGRDRAVDRGGEDREVGVARRTLFATTVTHNARAHDLVMRRGDLAVGAITDTAKERWNPGRQ
jgi:hypothetical protein